MSLKPSTLRHIKVFSTPAGTPSSGGTGDTRPGNRFPLPSFGQHWGILVEDESDTTGASDTYFELYRPGGGLGILRRSRPDREAQERTNSQKVIYSDTMCLTTWNDDEIEKLAVNICNDEMKGRYEVRNRNCQTLANLLVQRIATGSKPYKPYRTTSHALGAGPSQKVLFGVSEFDIGKPVKLRGKSTLEPADWTTLRLESEQIASGTSRNSTMEEELIDLDQAKRPEGPLSIEELRSNAYKWSRGPTSSQPEIPRPPPASLPQGYTEWLEGQEKVDDALFQESPPEKFPGARGDYLEFVTERVENIFKDAVTYHREYQARDEAMKVWYDPHVSAAERERKERERRILENSLLRERRAAVRAAMRADEREQQTSDEQGYSNDDLERNFGDPGLSMLTFEVDGGE